MTAFAITLLHDTPGRLVTLDADGMAVHDATGYVIQQDVNADNPLPELWVEYLCVERHVPPHRYVRKYRITSLTISAVGDEEDQ